MREILKKTTSQNGINFLDLNEYFCHDKFNEEWLFLSRFHFNDKGNKYLSDYLLSKAATTQANQNGLPTDGSVMKLDIDTIKFSDDKTSNQIVKRGLLEKIFGGVGPQQELPTTP